MGRSSLPVARYVLRATFRSRLAGYLSIVLLIGLVGGLALGAVAGARRTQSSFPAYIASGNPSDLGGVTGVLNPLIGSVKGYDPAAVDRIRHLPHVRSVRSEAGLDVGPVHADGSPVHIAAFPPSAGNGLGSVDGAELVQDRVSAVQGRLPDPRRADEIAMTEEVARQTGSHVGQRFSMGIYTNAQTLLPAFGTAAVKPSRRVEVTLVGIVVVPRQLVQDDVDNSQSLALFTPAFTRPLLDCCVNYSVSFIQVDGGAREVAAVQAGVRRILPPGFPSPVVAAETVAKAERAIRPESIALGVFGGIAAVAALLTAAQLIGRQIGTAAEERAVMRAVGAGPATTSAGVLVGILGAVVVGTVLAVAVAVALSPLAPLGPVHRVDPAGGVSFDWTVLGGGAALLLLALAAAAVVLASWSAPHRAPRLARPGRGASAVARAASVGMPAPAVTGIRFALEPGAGREAVPVRSAILGAFLAVVAVVGTIVFGSSLRSLVSHPPLYGWNWDYMLSAGGGSGDIPQSRAANLLDHDRYVAAWSAAYTDDLVIDGHVVPVLGQQPGAAIQPPVLSGHRLEDADQIVLGGVTLGQLHKHLGDTVEVSSGTGAPTRLQIVGTATMPTIGVSGEPHLEMGTGAVVSYELIPPAARNPFNDPTTGPETIFVNLRAGADHAAALRSLQRIAVATTNNFNFGVAVGPVLRPAEIVNYRTLGTTPAVLGGTLAAGAVVALALTLVASVRRRRRELAVLRTLGFTARQLAATVAWQSSVAVLVGTAVGLPVGIAVGRVLWKLFAEQIHAVPDPAVPVSWMVVTGLGALVLANLVAAAPGRVAARTPTALLLRAE